MSDSDDLVQGEPPVIDPYEVLGLELSATDAQIKSAYRKQALKHHPDKVAGADKEDATAKFQAIAFAYAVLSDPARRKRYDETGSTSEAVVDADGFSWSDFYREQFRDAVSTDAISKFAQKYKGSQEEKDDLLAAYDEHEGNMDGVYESVMLSDVVEDDERFRAIIDEAIHMKTVPAFRAYTKECKRSKRDRVKAARDEASEAEEYAKKLGVHDKLFSTGAGGSSSSSSKKGKKGKQDSEADLAALIQKNQASREDRQGSFLDNLAAKYAAPSKGKSKKRAVIDDDDEEEPSEEAFQAAAARLKKPKVDQGSSSSSSRRSVRSKK